ncbi:MAG: aminotransferase class I/II-fold pyridoxal phosphate-dependent enzyme [Ignavibacteriae bacterium]|nr:aminotransferase class I/II-fold pyridoxal phosphate-dependent enzyme [Ignavibacteriota bacterium]
MSNREFILSKTAKDLIPSGIRKISGKINERIEQGEKIFNLTIGDFSPQVFPIPEVLQHEIIKAYEERHTNYPPAVGVLPLRKAISKYLKERGGFEYNTDEIIIGSGARPLTYTIFLSVADPGDKIIFPAPSWNNNCYVQLVDAVPVVVETKVENDFTPTADELRPHLKDAVLLALNSPLNPSGTLFTKEALKEIIDMVVEENKRRTEEKRKPLYIFYDMVYWILTYGDKKHYNPVELNPGIRDYIIFIDGISKCFAATGVRLGWAFGPKEIMNKMQDIIAHIGAFAPKPEQIGTARFLENAKEVDKFFDYFKNELLTRLNIFYKEFESLKKDGFNVDAIEPQGAMYLTVKLDLTGMKTKSGKVLGDVDDVLGYVLEDAKIALVPFYAFGASKKSPWFRLSVGTCSVDEAKEAAIALRASLEKLRK